MSRKFRIVMAHYGEAEEHFGAYCWTEEQAEDLLEIIRCLRNCHTDDRTEGHEPTQEERAKGFYQSLLDEETGDE